jgi:hypothetical protein
VRRPDERLRAGVQGPVAEPGDLLVQVLGHRAVLERRASSTQALGLRAQIVLACAGLEAPPIVAVAPESCGWPPTPSASGRLI